MQTTLSKTATAIPAAVEQLTDALRSWSVEETSDWDALVSNQSHTPMPGGQDLWDRMPVVDSKAVARTAHIFERYLGIPLDVKLIRAGGYKSIDDMINHLVPAMQTVAEKKQHNQYEESNG